MASTRAHVLSIYKQMLREGQKFTGYNYREYAGRRVRDAFKEHKMEANQDTVQSLLKQATTQLQALHRMVILSQVYKEPTLVIENQKTEEVHIME